jgi:serine/threonine protein kinase
MKTTLDLKPYGIDFVFRPGKNEIEDIYTSKIIPATFNGSDMKKPLLSDSFTINHVNYAVKKILGSGSFGTTYQVTGPDGKDYALKSVQWNVDVFSEIVQQILVVNTTADLPDGPFAPRIFTVSHDKTKNNIYILSELMDDTIWNIIMGQTREQNDKAVPHIVSQVAYRLFELQNLLQFNHRDLKTNNVMYKTNPDGHSVVKFIDFGYSCMKWKGVHISSGEDSGVHFDKCYRESRDISQFITSILFFHKRVLSSKLKKELGNYITIDYGKKTRRATNLMRKWTKSYNLFNRNNLHWEHGKPTIVYEGMKHYTMKKSKPANVVPKHVVCPPEKIINPVTGRCVLRTGKIGRQLEKELAPVPAPSVVPVAAPSALVQVKPDCPPGKVRNPKTRRCVNRTGAIAKKAGLV